MERYETGGCDRVRDEIWRRELDVGREGRMRERGRRKTREGVWKEGRQPHWRPKLHRDKT
jgi:hypothetical protein